MKRYLAALLLMAWGTNAGAEYDCNYGGPGCVTMTASLNACSGTYYNWDLHWDGIGGQCFGGLCTNEIRAIKKKATSPSNAAWSHVEEVGSSGCKIVTYNYYWRMRHDYDEAGEHHANWNSNEVVTTRIACGGSGNP